MENENTNNASSSTVVTPKRKAVASKKPTPLPLFHVVLLDDNDHSVEYVVEMLKVLFAHPTEKGVDMAKTVDQQGRVIVFTTHKELAELKRDQIHSYGADQAVPTCKGSMSSIIQPAE